MSGFTRRAKCSILKRAMEMTFGGIAAMFVGWLAGRLLKLNDTDTVIVMLIAGGGSCLTGLAYLWIADIITGQSASPMWFVVGAIGGIAGVVVYIFTRYLDKLVQFAKDNGLL